MGTLAARPEARTAPGSGRGTRKPAPPGDGGSVTLELAVVFPAVIALIFGTVQAGIYYHCRSLAAVAAGQGLKAATADAGTAAAGNAGATGFLERAGADGWLTGQAASTTRTATAATVSVVGRSVSLVPGLPGLPVHQSATGPVERPTRKLGGNTK
jgi:Flp pilus assembly protein TadG